VTHPARRLWQRLEALHEVIYFVPEVRRTAGLPGYWPAYFAFRAAPLGRVDAAAVTAAFAVFDPDMVGRVLPAVWSQASPAACLAARLRVATGALRRIGVDERACAAAVEILAPVAAAADSTARPVGAANVAIPLPRDRVGALWQLATTFRELRNDGHVGAIAGAGLSGLAAHYLASGGVEYARTVRGWSERAWAECGDRLRGAGLLDVDSRPTPAGRERLAGVERTTDELAWQGALAALGEDGVATAVELLRPVVDAVWASGVLPDDKRAALDASGH
jgi:helix-turn-helix protein